MGKEWDRLDWTAGGGMAAVGMSRAIPWPSFSATGPAGSANASCATCKGRMRGPKKCSCEKPEWRVKDKPLDMNAQAKRGASQQAWHMAWLHEVYKALKPGGVVKVFGGTRLYHRLAAAMQQVGFQDIHLKAWGYGQGFPKSHNIAVYMDRMLTEGKSREIIRKGVGKLITDEAKQWDGWGTALKPAFEPVIVGYKR